ncbi:possible membrane protein [Vibrio maritimus]|uniref:Possible membrane protein n=1 Tax=Vibrio maritimus TaxID=990268 RepID=A0A090T3F7_9VIBR|nr:possible membrane protein [Vibrio maritimus]
MSQKLHNATNLYMEGIRDGNARQAVTKYTGARYTQHSTGVKNGIEGFVEFFEPFIERCHDRDIRIVRSIVDGQYVFVQAYQNINKGEAYWVTTDLFDTDENDKIIEHWDVISAYVENADTKRDQISGATGSVDLDKTEDNKALVREFLCDVMVLGQQEKMRNYVDVSHIHIHSGLDIDSAVEYVGSYDQVFKIIGQGNMVAAYSRLNQGHNEIARFDIFRIENEKIVEWWINQELVPPKNEWVNGGKF